MASLNRLRVALVAPIPLAEEAAFGPDSYALNASGKVLLVAAFQAPDALTITQLGFRYTSRTGTPPTYRISLQSVSTTTVGIPAGTVLGGASPASATFTPPASTAWNGTVQWVTLDNAYTCARGEMLAIVIDYSSGTIDGSNFGSFTLDLWHKSHRPWPASFDGATWTKAHNAPCFGYRTASATYGQPLVGSQIALTSSTANDEMAARFVVPAGTMTSYMLVGLRWYGKNSTATGSQELILYTGTTVLQSVTLDAEQFQAVDTIGTMECYFDETTLSALTPGAEYRVGLKLLSGWLTVYYASYAAAQDAASNPWAPYLSTRNAGAWTDVTTQVPRFELILDDFTATAGGGLLTHPGLAGGMRG